MIRVEPLEALPRRMIADFTVHADGGLQRVTVHVLVDDEEQPALFGDPLDDNAVLHDGYRFHDVIHLAHFAHIGWSPTVRTLLGRKRKSRPEVDRVQDGARAIAVEEALCALAYGLRDASPAPLPPAGFSALKRLTAGLEVEHVPELTWQVAYREAFDVMDALLESGGGRVIADRSRRTVTFEAREQ